MKNTKKLGLGLLLSFANLSYGWPTAIGISDDVTVSVSGTDIGGTGINSIDSCTIAVVANNLIDRCHRWDLIWSFSGSVLDNNPDSADLTAMTAWNPEVGGSGFRLPTIKELTKLFPYHTGDSLDPIIDEWITEADSNSGYLISSTYRDVDESADGIAYVLAMDVSNGHIVHLTPNDHRLCSSFDSSGYCDSLGASTENVYALIVNQTTVSNWP